ncbi:MAG: hypothetical protein AB7E72_01565 [Lysobacterales bacterium]
MIRTDQCEFSPLEAAAGFPGRLHFDGMTVEEDVLELRFLCPQIDIVGIVKTDSHLLLRFANESANFLEFNKLPINSCRLWVSESSKLLSELACLSGGVFDGVRPRHYLFVFSNATIEFVCLSEIVIDKEVCR